MEDKATEASTCYATRVQVRNFIRTRIWFTPGSYSVSFIPEIFAFSTALIIKYYFLTHSCVQCKFESVAFEIQVTEGDIRHTLMNIEEWAADEKVCMVFVPFVTLTLFIYISASEIDGQHVR